VNLGFNLTFACLREAASAKAGILKFDICLGICKFCIHWGDKEIVAGKCRRDH
jgi:hypothetical protein